ncbi:Rha family transcriptional regulator [Pantoea piersonii]|uniref:Rha family transcriptional regulator n=1 Tax=Pantoea piersonii TaxID=2364647 RepID=UPI0028AAD134|nr:Rha family transcriptional regulator [Pantoea piersonii]
MKAEKSRLISGAAPQPESSHEVILTQHRQESRVDSRLFARRVGIQHKNLAELIRKHAKPLRELGSLPSFETEAVKVAGARGVKYQRYYLLNETQFDYLCRIVRGRDAAGMKRLKLEVTKAFAHRRAAEPIRREYLPGYHESRDGLKALGAKRHHYINLAHAENRVAGLGSGERSNASEQQLGVLVVMQKIEQAAFEEATRNGLTPTEAVREVARRMDMFASLMTAVPAVGVAHD